MQARRGTALLLSCALGLLLLTAIHAAGQPEHGARGVALLAPAGLDSPPSWRSAPDDALPGAAGPAVVQSYATGGALAVQQFSTHATRTPQVRGPPGPAFA